MKFSSARAIMYLTSMAAFSASAANTNDPVVVSSMASSSAAICSVISVDTNAVVTSDLEIEVDFVLFDKKQIEALSRVKPLNKATLYGLYPHSSPF